MRQQILVTIIVIVIMLLHLRSAALISGVLPLAVLFAFIGMKLFGIDANVRDMCHDCFIGVHI